MASQLGFTLLIGLRHAQLSSLGSVGPASRQHAGRGHASVSAVWVELVCLWCGAGHLASPGLLQFEQRPVCGDITRPEDLRPRMRATWTSVDATVDKTSFVGVGMAA